MNGVDNWQYANEIQSIGRSFRLNPPTESEMEAGKAFLVIMRNARDWLAPTFDEIGSVGGYTNKQVGRLINLIGRDLMKIALQADDEKHACDALFDSTDERRNPLAK